MCHSHYRVCHHCLCMKVREDASLILSFSPFNVSFSYCCSSVAQSCPTFCNPMDCSTGSFPVLHCLSELVQTHVHWVSDAIQPSRHPLLFLNSIFPSIRVFSSESALHNRWPNYWSFSNNPSNEYSGLISFRIDWFDLAVQGTLKNLCQHHSSKASVLQLQLWWQT